MMAPVPYSMSTKFATHIGILSPVKGLKAYLSVKTPSLPSGSSDSRSISFFIAFSFVSSSTRGCFLARQTNVAPYSVSCLVVNIFTALPESTIAKSTSTPSLRPIQLRCIVTTRSGHPERLSQSFKSSSAYAVILKNHCSSSF